MPTTLALKDVCAPLPTLMTETLEIEPACAPAIFTSWPGISPRASSKMTAKVAVEDPCARVS